MMAISKVLGANLFSGLESFKSKYDQPYDLYTIFHYIPC